jgi:ubiquitin-conjugating enzyme E2 M
LEASMIGLKKKQKKKKEAAAAAAAAEEGAAAAVVGSGGASKGDDSGSASKKAKISITGQQRGRAKISGATGSKRPPAVVLRLQKDISELDGGDTAAVTFPDPSDLKIMNVSIAPKDGFWKGATYNFTIDVPNQYPHKAPTCTLKEKIYHPNIDLQGAVCLNILRADWKPVLDINAVIYGLIFLLHSPNGNDPLNHDAAKHFRENPRSFEQAVRTTLTGGSVRFDGKTTTGFKRLI